MTLRRPRIPNSEGPSTQYLRTLVPNTIAIKSMVFGTRNLKYWVLGTSGKGIGILVKVMQSQGRSRIPLCKSWGCRTAPVDCVFLQIGGPFKEV